MSLSKKKKARKRQNGEGSIWRLPNGRYAIAVTVPGTQGRKRLKATAPSLDLARVERDRLVKQARGGVIATRGLTLEAVANLWLANPKLSPNTVRVRQSTMKYVGDILRKRIDRLRPADIAQWAATSNLDNGGKRSSAPLLKFVKRVLAYAVELKLIETSPFTMRIKEPKRKGIKIHARTEAVDLIEVARSHRIGGAVVLAFTCSLRQGEAFGLQWGDVDWDKRAIHIERQAVPCPKGFGLNGSGVQIKPPKTERGIRTIPLPQIAYDTLIERRAAAFQEGLASRDDWIFPTKKGTPMNRNNFTVQVWGRLERAAEVPHRGLHHGRHSAATTMLGLSIPVEEVSAILGHKKVSTTYDTYCHHTPGTRRGAEAIDSAFGCTSVAPEPTIKLKKAR